VTYQLALRVPVRAKPTERKNRGRKKSAGDLRQAAIARASQAEVLRTGRSVMRVFKRMRSHCSEPTLGGTRLKPTNLTQADALSSFNGTVP